LKYFIGFKESEWKQHSPFLKRALIFIVSKDFESLIQKVYFKIRGSRPSLESLRKMFPKKNHHIVCIETSYVTLVSYEISKGFFERLVYTENPLLGAIKSKLFFYKINSKGEFLIVDTGLAVSKKKKIEAGLARIGIKH
jgi:hypothetical protein